MPPLRAHHGRSEYRPGRGHGRIRRSVGGGAKKQMVARSPRLLYQMPTDHKMKSDSFMVEMSGRFQPCQVLTRAARHHWEGPASLLWSPCSKWAVSLPTVQTD